MAFGQDETDDSGRKGSGGGGSGGGSGGSNVPWWQGPPPAGFTGTWPPALPPGASYGQIPGQIIYGPGSSLNTGTGTITNPGGSPTQAWGTGTPTPPTTTSGGTGGGSTNTAANLLTPFGVPFQPPSQLPYPGAPVFNKPAPFAPPSAQDVLNNDPGFNFRLSQGEGALQNSAAARGTLNGGGTLKDILDYGQQFASGEYSQAYGRALDQYNVNYKTQNYDPYYAALAPWQTNMASIQHQNDVNYANYNQHWQDLYNQYRNQKLDTFNMQLPILTA